MIKSEVMKATGNFHNQIIKPVPQVAEGIVNNAKDFHPTQAMFNPNSLARNETIGRFFLKGQVSTFGLLGRLKSLYVFRLVALKAGIFPQPAAWWKSPVLFVGQLLVMPFAFHGRTETLDFPGTLVGDDIVFAGVALLLAAVIRALARRVLTPPD